MGLVARPVVAVVAFQGLHRHTHVGGRSPRVGAGLHKPRGGRVAQPVRCDLWLQAGIGDDALKAPTHALDRTAAVGVQARLEAVEP